MGKSISVIATLPPLAIRDAAEAIDECPKSRGQMRMTRHSMVDARGLECPKPVIMTRDEVEDGTGSIEVLVDNGDALKNVTRFLRSAGYSVQYPEGEAGMEIHAFREELPSFALNPERHGRSTSGRKYSILILSDMLGAKSDGLGELLMKSFLDALLSLKPLPGIIALMSGGVMLALPESPCSETLRCLSFDGVRVLVCGTSAKHFDVAERIVIGDVSSVFEITEKVLRTNTPIVLG